MNILHINHSDQLGGAARSAYRIHQELTSRGQDSKMLVGRKYSKDMNVRMIGERFGLWTADSAISRILNWVGLQYLFCPSSHLLSSHDWFRQSDVLQLYNLHGDYFSYLVLPLLAKQKPIVWRFSDMWPLTGHCTYSFDCERWKNGCGHCPILHDYPEISIDTTALLWHLKKKILNQCKLTLVAPSQWMADRIKISPIFREFPCEVIPNGVDTDVFHATDKKKARQEIGIESVVNQVILFSAHSLEDKRKGIHHFRESLLKLHQKLKSPEQVEILLVGSHSKNFKFDVPFKVKTVDFTQRASEMCKVYAASDLFVFCSVAENLPNGILESMACGTPVIAFSEGGSKEIIRHMESGILVENHDSSMLSQQMAFLLENSKVLNDFANRGSRLIHECYSVKREVDQYQVLYEELIAEFRRNQTQGK